MCQQVNNYNSSKSLPGTCLRLTDLLLEFADRRRGEFGCGNLDGEQDSQYFECHDELSLSSI